jgi:hypothetical protein
MSAVQKTAILAQVGHFYFGAVGQFYVGANIWGGLHGVYLVLNHAWQKVLGRRHAEVAGTPIYSLLARAITFMSVVVGWVFFRAQTFDGAIRVLSAMSGPYGEVGEYTGVSGQGSGLLPFWLILSFVIVWMLPNTYEVALRWRIALDPYERSRSPALLPARLTLNGAWALGAAALFVYALLEVSTASEFLYFNF